MKTSERRLRGCVEAWPDAESGGYNPACCRFPKSCSPYPHQEAIDAGNVTDDDLEPVPDPATATATETLTEVGHDVRRMPMGMDCACHRHQEYVPMEVHHIWPRGLGGPDVAGNKVKVCCNAHYSIHELIRQLILTNGNVPWDQLQHYGAKVRALATRGWTEAGRPTHGGGGE